MFGRPVPELSMITNQVVDFIYDQHAHRLTQWNYQLLSPQCLRRYAEAVARKGGALANCFGFIGRDSEGNMSPWANAAVGLQWS